MWKLPIPLPNDPHLAEFVEARYGAKPEERARMEPPLLRKTRDGLLTALHYMYQNNPWVFAGGGIISITALAHAGFRVGRWLVT